MAEKKFIIEVRSKGFSRATRDFKNLEKNTKDYNKAADRLRGSTNGLIGSLGSLRNRLLVYSFALGGATVFVNKFVQASSGFEDVKTRLVGLTGSVSAANAAFDRFNAIAAKTPFQLQDVVNAGAQLEAFGVNAKATLRATTDLAAFMGTNATEAASALGRAFAGGAGAADILRERGILQIIKDSQGIEDLSKLTLPEFRKALIEALADPDGRISGSADRLSQTFSGAVSNMNDSLNRAAAEIGDILLPALKATVKLVDQFAASINKKQIVEFATALGIVSAAMGVIFFQTLRARLAVLLFDRTLTKTKVGLFITGVLMATDAILEFTGAFDHLESNTKDFNKELSDSDDELKKYIDSLGKASPETEKLAESMAEHKKSADNFTKSLEDQRHALIVQRAVLQGEREEIIAGMKAKVLVTQHNKQQLQDIKNLTAEVKSLTDAEKLRNDNIKLAADRSVELQDAMILVNTARKSEAEDVASNVEAQQRRLDVINQIGQVIQAEGAVLANLKNSFDVNTASIDENSKFLQVANNHYVTLTEEQAKAISVIVANAQANNLMTEELKKAAEAVEALTNQEKAREDKQKTFINLFAQTEEGQRKNIESTIQMVEENRKLFAELGNVDAVLAKLKDDLGNVGSDIDSTNDSSNKAASSINVLAGAMSALKGDTKDASQMFGIFLRTVGSLVAMSPQGATGGALLNLFSGFFAHTGGLITNRGIQRFANGGVVQGQDNVPIMAQAGEFVMRREAVQNIGVQNLAQMNRSGDAGGVTVNISAPLVDETVIDHIIPAINKATNRNLA
jgi:hypothetical protein